MAKFTAAAWLVVHPDSSTPGQQEDAAAGSSEAALQAQAEQPLLQRLLAEHRGLLADVAKFRADFEVLLSCLEESGFAVRHRLCPEPGPPAGTCAESVLALERPAACIFAGAGQAAWSAAMQASRSARRSAKAVQEEKLVVGGGLAAHTFGPVQRGAESLDVRSGAWETQPRLDWKNVGHVGAAVGRYLYVCGGHGSMGRSVNRLNPADMSWTSMAPMRRPRFCPAAAVVGGAIYVAGGCTLSEVWDSVECCRPNAAGEASAWTLTPGRVACRRSHAAVALRGKVFLCGGHNQPVGKPHVPKAAAAPATELFAVAPGASSEALPPMKKPRCYHAAALVNGRVLVCGGCPPGVIRALRSVESYDPVEASWSEYTAMPRACLGHAVAVAAGKLYILAGLARDEIGCPSEPSVQCMDLETGVWEELQPMQERRAGFFAGVITRGPSKVRWAK